MTRYFYLRGSDIVHDRGNATAPDPCIDGGHRCVKYDTVEDARVTANWLRDREAGYPSLRKFEGGANWPLHEWG